MFDLLVVLDDIARVLLAFLGVGIAAWIARGGPTE